MYASYMKNEIKLVSFDFDGTFIKENCWMVFNQACGIDPQIDKDYYRQYHAGEITYEEWIQGLVTIWKQKGLVTRDIGASVGDQLTLQDGMIEVLEYLRDQGYRVVVTTGGIDIVLRPFLEKFGIFDIIFTHESIFENDTFVSFINHAQADHMFEAGACKFSVFKQFLDKEGIAPKECAHIGDGANDMHIFSAVAEPFYFDPGAAAGEVPYTRITDMTELKNYL